MTVTTRSDRAMEGVLSYLEGYFTKAIGRLREKGVAIEHIAEYDKGYRDVLNGIRDYPAILVLERGRKEYDAWTTTYSMLVGLAYRAEDNELLQKNGAIYEDILEDAIRSDRKLGGACLDCNDLALDTDVTSSTFIISLAFEMWLTNDWEAEDSETDIGDGEEPSTVSSMQEGVSDDGESEDMSGMQDEAGSSTDSGE